MIIGSNCYKLINHIGNNLFCFSSFQRTRLLDNTERLERTGNNLEEGYKICVETGKPKGIYCYCYLFMSTILLDKELWLFNVVKCGHVQFNELSSE